MIDLKAMKSRKATVTPTLPVKTYLTDEARARLKAAAAFTGLYEYQILEELILKGLPSANKGDAKE